MFFRITGVRAYMGGYCVILGKTVDCSATLDALQEAKELVKAFGTRSSRVPHALSMIDSIFKKLQTQVRTRFEICYKNVFRTAGHSPKCVCVSRVTLRVLMLS